MANLYIYFKPTAAPRYRIQWKRSTDNLYPSGQNIDVDKAVGVWNSYTATIADTYTDWNFQVTPICDGNLGTPYYGTVKGECIPVNLTAIYVEPLKIRITSIARNAGTPTQQYRIEYRKQGDPTYISGPTLSYTQAQASPAGKLPIDLIVPEAWVGFNAEVRIASLCGQSTVVSVPITVPITFPAIVCVPATEVHSINTATASLTGLAVTIIKAEFTLKNGAGTATLFGPTLINVVAGAASNPYTGLIANTPYLISIRLIDEINGFEVYSDPCTTPFTTSSNPVIACIAATETHTETSVTATVNAIPAGITQVEFTLKNATGTTVLQGPFIVVVAAGSAARTFSTLTGATTYRVYTRLFHAASSTYSPLCYVEFTTSNVAIPPNLVWIPLAQACIKDNQFAVVKVISGLSSPINTWFDSTQNRVYVGDWDDAAGNVFWFNHITALVAADMTHSTAVIDPELYNNYIDSVNRRIYFVGRNSNGLIVYNIDTNTVSTVAFGTNGAFSRMTLVVSGNNIYCNNTPTGTLVIINRTTLVVTNTISIASITDNARFGIGGFQFIVVNSEIWVAAGSGSTIGTIGVYDLTFGTHLANITLPNSAVWTDGRYWQSIFYDATSGHVFIGDFGSGYRYVINAATRLVLQSRPSFNENGKLTTIHSWSINPITNDLYCSYSAQDNSVDASPIKRMYLESRSTYQYLNMYEGVYFGELKHITGTNRLVGTDAGNPYWSGVPGRLTDGTITILDSSISGNNTGMEVTLTLQQVDANNANTPTGLTKNNVIGDPNYVPPGVDLIDCPITYTLTCPTNKVSTYDASVLEYEFAILDSVKANPAIGKIKVYAFNMVTNLPVGAPQIITGPFTSNYISGTLTGMIGLSYDIQVVYTTAADAILQTCNP